MDLMKPTSHLLAALGALALGACTLHDPNEAGLLVPRTVAEDPDLPSFALSDGVLLHLETFGDPRDEALIVLHGGPGGDYRGCLSLAELSDEFFVVLWDQRGAGLSERVPESQLNGPQYLADLEELAERFSPGRPFVLLGHSWGGAYATYYVQHHPDRVRALVLVEPAALTPEAAEVANQAPIDLTDADLSQYLETSDYLAPDGEEAKDYFFAILNANLGGLDDFASAREKERAAFWRNGYSANHGINAWQGNFATPTFDATRGLEAFTAPTLLVGGTASKRLGYDFQAKHHAPRFQDVRLHKLEGAGHYSPQYNAPALLPALRAFLSEGATATTQEEP